MQHFFMHTLSVSDWLHRLSVLQPVLSLVSLSDPTVLPMAVMSSHFGSFAAIAEHISLRSLWRFICCCAGPDWLVKKNKSMVGTSTASIMYITVSIAIATPFILSLCNQIEFQIST